MMKEVNKMQTNLFRRGIVFGIILLFIGLSVTSSISGYIGKMSNQSNEEAPTNFPFLNNGLLANWSFDEGSGNITHDYSGNNYNGTIYGATWITHLTGYALDFDGVDDYIGLDNYSENLGFNKTDNYKISVWINSTSTDIGIIYGMSNSIGNDPEAYLELNSDGNLVMQVWAYQTCGISVSSNGAYNDGLWHYVEVIFRGNISKPTIEIYVDGELDVSVTDWVCPFYSNEFERAKIGRRACNSTKYFDGMIDEVKVYKNFNLPPNSPSNPDPENGSTDVNVDANLSWNCSDPEGDDLTYDVYFEANDPTPDELVSENQTGTTYDPGTMEYSTHYYWRIIAKDNHSASTWGPVWHFTTEKAHIPDLECNGTLSWSGVKPGEIVTGFFTVENIGKPGSLLDWTILTWPSWGNWTFTKLSGEDLKPEDGIEIVGVTVVAPDEQNGGFSGYLLLINTENGNDYDIIDVSLATPKNKAFNMNLLFLRFLENHPHMFLILRHLLGV